MVKRLHKIKSDRIKTVKTVKHGLSKAKIDWINRTQSGKRTRITPAVIAFASRFSGKNLRTVKRMAQAYIEFGRQYKGAIFLYGRTNASQVFSSNKIPMFKITRKGRKPLNTGCMHAGDAFIAALRAKGIKCKMVRFRQREGTPHSEAVFKIGEKEFVVDFSSLKFPDVYELDSKRRKFYADLKAQGLLREGRDSYTCGVKSVKDFWIGEKPEGYELVEYADRPLKAEII